VSGPPGPPELPVEPGPRARAALQAVLELLRDDPASLSSVIEPERGWRVHVADSLTGLQVAELASARRIADIGAAALPEARVDLIESVGRKCGFMRRALAVAEISNAEVVEDRSESWAAESPPAGGAGSYEAATARAVGRLSTLAELASPLLAEGGVLVAWKGRRDPEEEAELAAASARLAMEPLAVLSVGEQAGSKHRHLHPMRKIGPTPQDLPRRAGMAKKRPYGRGRSAD